MNFTGSVIYVRSLKSDAQTPGLFLLMQEEAFFECPIPDLYRNADQERRELNRSTGNAPTSFDALARQTNNIPPCHLPATCGRLTHPRLIPFQRG